MRPATAQQLDREEDLLVEAAERVRAQMRMPEQQDRHERI
jgi:hypothetical protein